MYYRGKKPLGKREIWQTLAALSRNGTVYGEKLIERPDWPNLPPITGDIGGIHLTRVVKSSVAPAAQSEGHKAVQGETRIN